MTRARGFRPFVVDVPEAVLEDLRDRLARTRWPDQLAEAGWDYGTELDALQALCEYWRTTFDWRAAERRLNAFPQVTTTVDGELIHLVHVRSPHPGALPLLLLHGWPGSIVEFLDTIEPLVDPPAHGGDESDAFHVVVPSLPGFGFSGPTRRRGVDARGIAALVAEAMRGLGYESYVAQGGDWGARILRGLGAVAPEQLLGAHFTTFTPQPTDDELLLAAPGEPVRRHDPDDLGYQQIQATRPQTLAYGLADSPAGLAGWILEKFRLWSDCDGDVERAFTKDALLTNVTLYWVTGTINSANRLYYEEGVGRSTTPFPPLRMPSGYAAFPADISRPPRAWVERDHLLQLVHWTEQPRGGHFAAFEQPGLFVADVRAFARRLRQTSQAT